MIEKKEKKEKILSHVYFLLISLLVVFTTLSKVEGADWYQVDNQIKNSEGGEYRGDGIYNITAIGQMVAKEIKHGETVICHIKIENDGNTADTFTVTGPGGDANWTIVYYDALSAGNNITGSVTGGGWSTGSLLSGEAREIRVEVTPGEGAISGVFKNVLITSTSQADTDKKDAVQAAVTVSCAHPVDNQIKNSVDGVYIGDDVYNHDGTDQTKTQMARNEETAIYHIKIENENFEDEDTFSVTGTGGDANWTVTYYDALSAGSNITSNITGTGWVIDILRGETREIRIEVTPGESVAGGLSKEILITSILQGESDTEDVVKAITTVTSDYQTDNHIKNSAEGTYIGNNIYNTDGSNQTKAQNVDNGATAIYHIRIQNDGNIADTFTVTGTGGAANWIVTYYDALVAGSNITANVTGSGWSIGALVSGGTREIRVEVTPGAGAGGGTSREILITSTSQGDGNADAVKATTTVTIDYQTDNHIKNSAEGTYIGDNIYNTDGSNQTKAQNVDNGITAIYHIRIQNDGNIADTFTVTGTGGDANWTVTYYDAVVSGNNITANVTGSGWSSGALVSGGTIGIRVEVTPGAGAGGGTSREILITSTSEGDSNADAVKTTTTVTSDYQTDNHIKNSGEGTYIGNNIYNTDGSNQTKAQNVDNGATAIYHIRIQNDGNIADTFTVTGTGGDANWTVTYYDALVAGNNITASVTGSGWFTGALDSGGTKEIRIEVTPGAGATGGTSREILITSASQGDGNADAVKATTTVTSDYQTDNHIKNSAEGTYIGNNIYNTDGSNQTKAQNVDNGATAIYHIIIQNDGNIADTFTVTGTGGAANWIVTYYDALVAGSNITANVTGSGWSSGALVSGGTREIRVEVTPGAGAGGGTSREILITSTSQGDGNADAVKATTTVNSDYQTDNHIKNSAEGTYIGNNIYNTDGSNQTKAQNVDNGATAIYHIRIQNDGNIADTFTVTGTGGDANWIVTYYDALVAGSNITANVTGSGWSSGALVSGGTRGIRVEVTPGAGATGGTSREILITSASQGDGNADAVKATTTVTSDYQTDNHIKNSAEGTYIGNNIYNTDGSNQTKAQNVDNGATAIYHIIIQNDGNIADTFTVTGTGGAANWIVTYYDALVAGSNITANVTGSGWSSGALNSGGTKEIRVEVTPGAGAGGGTSREILITSTSQGDGNADAVKATTTVSSDYQTDNHIKNSAEGTYIGNNIYNTDGSNQTKAQNVDNGATAIYHIRIENDGNIADTFTVTGTGGDANWIVTYYDALVAGSNITANVTGSGWFTGALDSGGTKEIRIEVTPGAGAGGGTSREILITSTSQGDGNADAVKAVTTVDSISNYCVDNQIKNNGETSYLGNGIYNLNGADQTAEQGVENNQTATYHIKVENDGSLPDTFTITGIAGDVNWTIVYYDALSGGNNITDNIIGSGWLTDSLASGGIKEIRVEVTPGGGVGDGLIKEVLINSQSVGDTNKEDVVKAITTCINVAMPYIKIETKADGSGSEVDSQTINSEDSLIVYAVHRDTSGVYVANVEASWGLIEKTRGAVDTDLKPALDNKSATFTGHRVGTAKIKAEHTTLRDDSTGMITVVAGNPTHIKIVDNTGREIYTKAIDVGDSFPVYALSKDANENYVEDVAVTWRLIEKVGDIVDSDLVSALNNRSATFKGKGIGKAKIKACHSSLGDDETGDISVRISKTVFHPVYPNPFRLRKDGTVIFQYDLAEDVSSIGIEIYTLAGDLVRKWSGNTRRGRHRIFWDATNQGGRMVSSGMYFIVIKKDGKVISRKRMVIIK